VVLAGFGCGHHGTVNINQPSADIQTKISSHSWVLDA